MRLHIDAYCLGESGRFILLDRCVNRDQRRARRVRPLTGCPDGKSVTSFVSRLRLVFVSRNVELL
jgi:hypothetical protein